MSGGSHRFLCDKGLCKAASVIAAPRRLEKGVVTATATILHCPLCGVGYALQDVQLSSNGLIAISPDSTTYEPGRDYWGFLEFKMVGCRHLCFRVPGCRGQTTDPRTPFQTESRHSETHKATSPPSASPMELLQPTGTTSGAGQPAAVGCSPASTWRMRPSSRGTAARETPPSSSFWACQVLCSWSLQQAHRRT